MRYSCWIYTRICLSFLRLVELSLALGSGNPVMLDEVAQHSLQRIEHSLGVLLGPTFAIG